MISQFEMSTNLWDIFLKFADQPEELRLKLISHLFLPSKKTTIKAAALMNKIHNGFTLIELLVVLAVIGILSTLAVPSYSLYVTRAKITTAQADLISISMRLENRYQRVLSYPTTAYSTTATLNAVVSGWTPASKGTDFVFSNVVSTPADASTYTIKATGQSGQVKDCVITLKEDGTKEISSCSVVSDGNWL